MLRCARLDRTVRGMSSTAAEILSQPDTWAWAVSELPTFAAALPSSGERVAVIGCGTSSYIAEAYARARENREAGETDAVVASEFGARRPYDRVIAISRSGTTTEVVRALNALAGRLRSTAISAVADSPVARAAREAVILDAADEESVVQTRFATTTLALLRAHLGEDLSGAIVDARHAVEQPLPVDPGGFERFVFLGTGWSAGLAHEAALKMREAAHAWSESYPAMEYRHGPISLAGPGTLVWHLGPADPDLVGDVEATGASVVCGALDPMAELILVQRTAVTLALARGLDPDHPRNLTRSVVLS
jgi:fructoselysine-6-P-deglycase FrlB-like protein